MNKRKGGDEGKQWADDYWDDLHITEPHALLHGFEAISSRGYTHQIDKMLVISRFVLVVERHEKFIKRLLDRIHLELPVLSVVIFTSSSSILENMPERFHIFKLAGLHFKLEEWMNTYPVQVPESMVSLVRNELLTHH